MPPYSTVFWYYKQWREEGVIDDIMDKLHAKAREQVKKAQWTMLIIVDSQAVRNTCNASIASKVFCHLGSIETFSIFSETLVEGSILGGYCLFRESYM